MSDGEPSLAKQGRNSRRRGLALACGLAAGLAVSALSYDALGYYQASRFEREHADEPALVLARWQAFRLWHPTRHWLGFDSLEAEARRLRDTGQRQQLTELRRQARDVDADPEQTWQRFLAFRADFPETDIDDDLHKLRQQIKSRRDAEQESRALAAFDELVSSEQRGTELRQVLVQADRFLASFADTTLADDVRRRRAALVLRLEERDIDSARDLSLREPLDFRSRKEHYQRYLDKHPNGTFATEARNALQNIDADWDKADFRLVRDHYEARPGEVAELAKRCSTYLAAHPEGSFASKAQELLRWSERVSQRGEYKVTLKSGHFEKSVARFFSRGPDLSVELVVNGVRHGPSNIVANRYDPEWNYEFPRPIRWKIGDSIHIVVTDHDWKDRTVLYLATEPDDLVSIRWLCGETWSGKNHLVFESDFTMPSLSGIE
jgi:hypothetical protein